MSQNQSSKKLKSLRIALVPAIFSDRQFNVLIKKLNSERLTQVERNYLSNAIKAKIKAIELVKHTNVKEIYARRKDEFKIETVIACYKKAGIDLVGYKTIKAKAITPREAVTKIIYNHLQIEARIVDLLPVFILKNLDKINLFEVYDFAVENSLANFTGYVFNIAYAYSGNENIKRLLAALDKRKDNLPVFRDERYETMQELIKQDDVCRRWNIYTLNSTEDYKKYIELYS
ncbi:TPA: hypothetical protein HA246_01165 [Candidatus Woesearchaeota archaeon]|nr:hypothetical protein [Candidatus Woesearchaeota archaeon]